MFKMGAKREEVYHKISLNPIRSADHVRAIGLCDYIHLIDVALTNAAPTTVGKPNSGARSGILAIARHSVKCMQRCGIVKRGRDGFTVEGPTDGSEIAFDEVAQAIDGERDYQDSLGPDRVTKRTKTMAEYICLMQVCSHRAKIAYYNHPGDVHAIHEIRKLAALAVQALEVFGVNNAI